MWHYKLPVFDVGESKNSISIENRRADFSCADGGCIRGASFKAEGRLMIWPLPSPQGREEKGSRHLPLGALRCTVAVKRQQWFSTGRSGRSNSWLAPQPPLLSGSHHPAYIHPRRCASFTQTHTHTHIHPTAAREPPRQQIFTLLP